MPPQTEKSLKSLNATFVWRTELWVLEFCVGMHHSEPRTAIMENDISHVAFISFDKPRPFI